MAENGQPPLPPQPPADPAPAPNPAEARPSQEVCRKYVWGTCNKLTNCRFRHEHKFEEMVEILKFCHNFQNKGVCDFDRCSYLHTTTQEETLFKTEGIIPRVLQERYAAKAGAVAPVAVAAPPPGFSYPMMPHAEGMQGSEGMLMPPPPPPPPAAAAPPPPPPPATAPPARAQQTTANNVNVFNPPPTFTYPSPAPPNVATTIAVFDSSRPPPNFSPCENIVSRTKRRCSGDLNGAGPRKTAKTSPNRLCEQCNLRRIRSAEMERYIQQMIVQEADLSLEYRKKKEQFLQKRRILLSLINPEHQTAIEEYIAGVPSVQPQDANHYHQQLVRQLNSNTHSNTKKVIMKLLEMILNKTFEGASLPSAPPIFRGVEESPAFSPFIRQSLAQTVEENSPVGGLLSTVNQLLANRPAVPETNDIASMLAMLQNDSSRYEPPPPGPGEFARGGYPDVVGPSAAVAVRPPAPPYQYYPEPGPSHAARPTRQTMQRYSYQEAGPSQAATAPAPPPAAVPFSFHVPPPPPPPAPRAYAPYAPHHAVMGSRERH